MAAEDIEGILRRWERYYSMLPGHRNNSIFKLAIDYNTYGISYAEALDVCLRYVDLSGKDHFTDREITTAVKSAYRRTEHGVKQWTPGKITRPVPPRRVLSKAQAQAVEDRLVEAMRERWQSVCITAPPEPTAPIEDQPPTRNMASIPSDAEIILQEITEQNPSLLTLMEVLDIDQQKARIIPMIPQKR